MNSSIAFQIDRNDNVCTSLQALEPGVVRITGQSELEQITIAADIPKGHKIAVKPIEAGEPVVKYGVSIGIATKPIAPGEWVHLHNCRSAFDERSSTLDPETGAPTDTPYE